MDEKLTGNRSSGVVANTRSGWINGLMGVMIFGGSLPATRAAVIDFDPVFLTTARASIAALLAWAFLLLLRQRRPDRGEVVSLALVAGGVVVGYPLLTALALQHVSSAHSTVFLGLLPLCTAIFGFLRGGERPRLAFWLFSLLGSVLVAGYSVFNAGEASLRGDSLMLGAVIVCGFGYAEGARLSRNLGGWQTISWALVLSLPVMLPITLWTLPVSVAHVGAAAWVGFAYVSLFSMLIGFIFWYRGLAQGGIAAVGQLQLLQPFFSLGLAAVFLNEAVNPAMLWVTLGAVGCVAGARKFAGAARAPEPMMKAIPASAN